MTFSIVARCAETGQFGLAISSSSPAVAARCAFARAGVGAVASQNVTNPALGPRVLDLMQGGAGAEAAVAGAIAQEPFPEYRQVLAVDAAGGRAVHSGAKALGVWTSAIGVDCASGGNLLADLAVPGAIVAGFETASGALGDRLIAAMQAGLAAGGEAGPVHSAGLLIVDAQAWPYAELRCDWTEDCPIAAIATAWEVYEPQAEAYVTRALNPTDAPSYGVPGDE
ncbi:MAG: fimbrial assembly protein FimA [Rhodobacteraceae bacterium]|nr:fimbrial assembly protein FimA [Paracoccaceae bacterium]